MPSSSRSKSVAGPHAALTNLIEAHGIQEVMRVLSVILRVEMNDADAADEIGRTRQAIYVRSLNNEAA